MELRSLYFTFVGQKNIDRGRISSLIYTHHLLEMQRQDERWIISIIHCYCSLLDITTAFILNVELLTGFEIGSVARIPPGAKQSSESVPSLAASNGRKLLQFISD